MGPSPSGTARTCSPPCCSSSSSDQESGHTQALVEAARGTRLEKLMAYIAARNQRRLAKAKEKELSLQAQRTQAP